jgi:hypothetical protein
MKRFAAATIATLAAAGIAGTATPALAQDTVLVGQHGTNQIWMSYDEPYTVEQTNTYWDFVPLDGMCGFAGTKLILSDMTERFLIQAKQQGAQAGSFTGTGKILDETFELTQYDAAGNTVRVFTGAGDELAQFRGTGASGQQADTSVNLRVSFRGASDDGTKLSFSLKLRMRVDQKTGVPTKFEAAVDGCHVN